MKNTNSKEYKATVREYLTPIVIEALEGREKSTEGNIFKSIIDCARSEEPHEFSRHGQQGGLAQWLQGLGMGIDFYNGEIIRVCESLHDCKLSDKEAEKCVENWFNHIAFKILQFSKEG